MNIRVGVLQKRIPAFQRTSAEATAIGSIDRVMPVHLWGTARDGERELTISIRASIRLVRLPPTLASAPPISFVASRRTWTGRRPNDCPHATAGSIPFWPSRGLRARLPPRATEIGIESNPGNPEKPCP
jgi:hypothetical protein